MIASRLRILPFGPSNRNRSDRLIHTPMRARREVPETRRSARGVQFSRRSDGGLNPRALGIRNPPQYSGRNSISRARPLPPPRPSEPPPRWPTAMVGLGRVCRQAICKRARHDQNFMYAFLSVTSGWRSDIWNFSSSSRAIMSRSCWLSGSSIVVGDTHPAVDVAIKNSGLALFVSHVDILEPVQVVPAHELHVFLTGTA